uniref:TATA box-binding protein-associated factor RNA polymerase I subunit B n=1 Tax=Lepisosteus oculatus TaxID=7918 RepID=W5NJJ7_LEPOC
MDDEHTKDYREPCLVCSEVDWGLTDEGKFYCRSCQNVIERTKELDPEDVFCGSSSRISSISQSLRQKKKLERGREWMVCEAFQFILQKQASALLEMGVDPQFKDGVLLTFWRRYLQKSQQAYSRSPLRIQHQRIVSDCSESDSAPGSVLSGWSESDEVDTELGSVSGCRSPSSAVSSDVASVCSGSLDGGQYRSKARRCGMLMSLPMTLAFCHLSLLWLREPLALADLLRFVAAGLIPYVNVYQILPEEMRLFGQDLHIFRTESIPSHKSVQKEAHRVAVFLDLPRFPPITEDCFLHPSVLCIKYLMEANLPDELHSWVCRVISHTGMGKEAFLTYDPLHKKTQPLNYDIQAAALIIVTLKLLFKLDDKMECIYSTSTVSSQKQDCNWMTMPQKTSFSFRKWFKTVKQTLDEALEKEERDVARQSWKPYKPLYPSLKEKAVVLKRRRMVEHLQQHFQRLSGPAPDPPAPGGSSFVFSWGEDSAEQPCFHRHRVDAVIRDWPDSSRVSNTKYWHTALKSCEPQKCGLHFEMEEPVLPRSYLFVLSLFSFLLKVDVAKIHAEVCEVESRLL